MVLTRLARRRAAEDERGAVAILVAVLAVSLFLIAALVVDLGLARDNRRQSQNAADASALAAGNVLYLTGGACSTAPCFTQAIDAAKSYAEVNYGVATSAWSACTDASKLSYVPTGQSPCISFDSATAPKHVRVKIPDRSIDTTFGTFAGVENISIGAAARASLQTGGVLPCGLCVIGPGPHDLQNGDTTVTGAGAHFNGSVSVGPNGLVSTGGNTVQGTVNRPGNFTPAAITGSPQIPDPLAELALPPSMVGLSAQTANTSATPCVLQPGIYVGFQIRAKTCTMNPGLYVFRSGTLDLASNPSTRLQGTGVTLYFTCSTGTTVRACNANESGATMDFSGNGSLALTGPTSGELKGLSIVYDRNNTSGLRLTGNGVTGTSGTIYMANGLLDIRGNGCSTAYSAVIVKSLAYSGTNSCLNVNYNSGQNYQPLPAGLHLSR
ncbi:pilus assembly protein TadG-related protein [Nocardioides bigeumensis]|uniref:Putative Flp pilus-assembly TadG-like N-terminal domain-containing protein n=1 Tax=Nocardioides bigeumensis TaxID=433657 RepID=A0ABN2XT07_9ACTN